MMLVQVYIYVKTNQVILLRFVHFILYKLHFSKVLGGKSAALYKSKHAFSQNSKQVDMLS